MRDFIEHNWQVQLNVFNGFAHLPVFNAVNLSTIKSADYYCNSLRDLEELNIFQYTISGCGCFDDGDKIHALAPGRGFILNSSARNYSYYYPESATEPWVVLWGHFSSGASWNMVTEIIQRFGHIFDLSPKSEIISTLRSFESSAGDRNLFVSESATLVNKLLNSIVWSHEQQISCQADEHLLKRAIKLIGEHENYLYKVSELAEQLNISREHLSRAFRRKLNISPYKYITNRKIESCKLLLRSSSRSIKELSYDTGFDTPNLFSAIFKKYTGITPNQYRRLAIKR
jgi:AraC-like DNA-binding protein